MNKTAGFASMGIAFLAAVQACGGSVTGAPGSTSSGTAGTASTSSGSVSTSGGGASPATTSSGAGAGTAASSSSAGTGASTATSSSTGTATASSSSGGPTCPTAAPDNGAACTSQGEACTYNNGTTGCDCTATAGALVWTCHVCPTTQPAANATCPGEAGATCAYGATNCTCGGGGGTVGGDRWTCGTCPATEPTNASACTTVNLACSYSGTDCTCEGTAGPAGGGGDKWACNAPCPTAEPTPGDTCDVAAGKACTYGTASCDCRAAMAGGATTWFCN